MIRKQMIRKMKRSAALGLAMLGALAGCTLGDPTAPASSEYADVGAIEGAASPSVSTPTYIAFVSRRGERGSSVEYNIDLIRSDGLGRTRLTTGLDGVSPPRWAPDGSRLEFFGAKGGRDAYYIVDVQVTGAEIRASEPQRLPDIPVSARHLAWSPDGSMIASSRGDSIHVMRADGTGERLLVPPEPVTVGQMSQTHPAWSPDGSRIAFTRWTQNQETTATQRLALVDVDGSDYQELHAQDRLFFAFCCATWSPDGSKIAFARWHRVGAGTVFVVDADGTGVVGEISGGGGPAWSPDGSLLAMAHNVHGIQVAAPDGSDLRRLGSGVGPTWSPDGAKIAFSVPGAGGASDLYVIGRDGAGLRRLTATPDEDEHEPTWRPSPNGPAPR